MAASENAVHDDLVHIKDVSRKTTIAEILNIAAKRINFLGFPKLDLKMGLMQHTSQEPADNDDIAAPPSHAENLPQVPASHKK